jgi:hypothetical protein
MRETYDDNLNCSLSANDLSAGFPSLDVQQGNRKLQLHFNCPRFQCKITFFLNACNSRGKSVRSRTVKSKMQWDPRVGEAVFKEAYVVHTVNNIFAAAVIYKNLSGFLHR